MLNKSIKIYLNKTLIKILVSRYPPIIVASMGRSGSTLIYDAICESVAEKRFKYFPWLKQRIVFDAAWDLDAQTYRSGAVYKTHGLGHELPKGTESKVIFLFGPASESALSVFKCKEKKGDAWIKEHFQHMRADGEFSEIGERDVLRFEEQLDSWSLKRDVPVMLLHYDAIWENQDTIAEFLGLPIKLPERRPRSASSEIDEATRKKFETTYRELDKRISEMPRCQILE